ncbi:MAG: 50S ribosomal protein L22 [Candidatus Hydrogenedentes bacterium]|jgi:large subunit ribosomal protein L22|nr:50S ribosomal protein L22 [Candidatus Hydrogenedentota bacterium]
MANAKASVTRVPIAPRKMRLVADLIRGQRVADARDILAYTTKISAPVIQKVLESAVANAESAASEAGTRIDSDEMVVTHISVDSGPTQKRFMPAPRGRANRIRKRSSHLQLVIAEG